MRKRQQSGITAAAFAATLGLTTLAACGEAADGPANAGTQCNSKSCFERQFADCKPATYASGQMAGAKVRYRINGPVDGGCKVTFVFLQNPNPDWADKPLHMVLDSGKAFAAQAKDAIKQCLANDLAGPYQCSGPLRGAMNWGAARRGDGPVPQNEASSSGAPAKPQTVTEPPCGETVKVSGEPLYALPDNGRWGFVNHAGDWVIKPQWSQVGPFSEGRAVVGKGYSHGSAWGVIDRSGAYIVKPTIPSSYASGPRVPHPPIKPFSHGCAAVQPGVSPSNNHPTPYFITRDGRFWLRDGLPESLAGQKVKEFGSFSEGLAWFRIIDFDSDKEYGYIDTQGRVVIDVKYTHAGNFAHGLAPAAIKRSGHWGYINPKGELAWPGKWRLAYAHEFSQGLAQIALKSKKPFGDNRHVYFDGDKIVMDTLHFDPPRHVTTKNGQASFDTAPITSAGSFSDGLAPMLTAPKTKPRVPRRLYYMNTDGKAVLAPHDALGVTICNASRRPQFHHGLARLRVANKNGKCDQPKKTANGQFETHAQSHIVYIDTDGEIVLEEPFRNVDKGAHSANGDKQ